MVGPRSSIDDRGRTQVGKIDCARGRERVMVPIGIACRPCASTSKCSANLFLRNFTLQIVFARPTKLCEINIAESLLPTRRGPPQHDGEDHPRWHEPRVSVRREPLVLARRSTDIFDVSWGSVHAACGQCD